MLTFLPTAFCTLSGQADETFTGLLPLEGPGLWAGVVSSGRCTVGEAALADPGDFFLGEGPLALSAPLPCHIAALRLAGTAPEALRLPAARLLRGTACPRCGETMALLLSGTQSPGRVSSLAYALLCDLWEGGESDRALPALAADAISRIREDYATLYGVEDLAEALGVSKCHLIRVFSASVGVPPGQYLTSVRLEAAKELLLCREYTLETVAGLCGFSGANYFCRVFRRGVGLTPAAWLAAAGPRETRGTGPVIL